MVRHHRSTRPGEHVRTRALAVLAPIAGTCCLGAVLAGGLPAAQAVAVVVGLSSAGYAGPLVTAVPAIRSRGASLLGISR